MRQSEPVPCWVIRESHRKGDHDYAVHSTKEPPVLNEGWSVDENASFCHSYFEELTGLHLEPGEVARVLFRVEVLEPSTRTTRSVGETPCPQPTLLEAQVREAIAILKDGTDYERMHIVGILRAGLEGTTTEDTREQDAESDDRGEPTPNAGKREPRASLTGRAARRRVDLRRITPAERAIYAARDAVESVPDADERLTHAVVALAMAKDHLSDYFDGVVPDAPGPPEDAPEGEQRREIQDAACEPTHRILRDHRAMEALMDALAPFAVTETDREIAVPMRCQASGELQRAALYPADFDRARAILAALRGEQEDEDG